MTLYTVRTTITRGEEYTDTTIFENCAEDTLGRHFMQISRLEDESASAVEVGEMYLDRCEIGVLPIVIRPSYYNL